MPPKNQNISSKIRFSKYTMSLSQKYIFSQPIPLHGGLRQRVRNLFMCVYIYGWWVGSTVISSSSSSSSSVEKGSSWTCVGAVPRDLSLYDIILLLLSLLFLLILLQSLQYNTIQYNTLQYNTIQYNTIQYNTIQ